MDRIKKALQRLSLKEREQVKFIMTQLNRGSFKYLDLKKLKGRKDIFRVRKGSLRIIFQKKSRGKIAILVIERRSETTYTF